MSAPLWSFVMIHHSAGHDEPGPDIQAIRAFHTAPEPAGRGWRDIGYHFVCELVGEHYEVLAGRPLSEDGAHCPGMNHSAIGLCLVGDFTAHPPPLGQMLTAAKFVAGLLSALRLPSSAVTMHRNHRATECPGKSFDLEQFRRLVEDFL